MNYIISLFGIAIIILGAVILLDHVRYFKWFLEKVDQLSLQIFAVVWRLVLGVGLVSYASSSKFIVGFAIIGLFFILQAVVFAVIGTPRFKKYMAWAVKYNSSIWPFGGISAIALGSLFVYGVL